MNPSPRDQARTWERIASLLGSRIDLSDIPGTEDWARQELRAMAAKTAPPVVFRWLGDPDGCAVFELGRGDDVRRMSSKCRGHWVLWWLLDNPRRSFDPVGIAAPDAAWPAKTVRQAIVGEAATTYERLGFPELVAAAKACKVRKGVICLELPSNAPSIITN